MKEKFTVNCAVFDGEKVYENAIVTVENGIIVSLRLNLSMSILCNLYDTFIFHQFLSNLLYSLLY